MIRRSISRAVTRDNTTTIAITSRRCHGSMRPEFDGRTPVPQCSGPRLCSNGAMRLALWFAFVCTFAALNLYARSAGTRPDDDAVFQYDFAFGSLAGYAVLFSLVL